MAKKWCKIVELENYDVLAQRLSNDDDGEHIRVSTQASYGHVSVVISAGEDADEADQMFDKFDEVGAKQVLGMLRINPDDNGN